MSIVFWRLALLVTSVSSLYVGIQFLKSQKVRDVITLGGKGEGVEERIFNPPPTEKRQRNSFM
jgi:hypothetical protein